MHLLDSDLAVEAASSQFRPSPRRFFSGVVAVLAFLILACLAVAVSADAPGAVLVWLACGGSVCAVTAWCLWRPTVLTRRLAAGTLVAGAAAAMVPFWWSGTPGDGAGHVQFCENEVCKDTGGGFAQAVGERGTAFAGLYLSSLQGLLDDEEQADLEAILDVEYELLKSDSRFAGLPNALLVRSDAKTVRFLSWVPGSGRYPCIIFLHGYGGMLTPYLRTLVDSQLGGEAVLLAPMLNNDGDWWEADAAGVLQRLLLHLPVQVDRDRIYVMGLSNGAVGAIRLVAQPQLAGVFRGFILVSGAALLDSETSVDTRVLMVHGRHDVRFGVPYMDQCARRLRESGAETELHLLDSNHFMLLTRTPALASIISDWMH